MPLRLTRRPRRAPAVVNGPKTPLAEKASWVRLGNLVTGVSGLLEAFGGLRAKHVNRAARELCYVESLKGHGGNDGRAKRTRDWRECSYKDTRRHLQISDQGYVGGVDEARHGTDPKDHASSGERTWRFLSGDQR